MPQHTERKLYGAEQYMTNTVPKGHLLKKEDSRSDKRFKAIALGTGWHF